jgi:hypothetical protein
MKQVLEHPSPLVVSPSSQVSLLSRMPLPHLVQLLPEHP